ncbi:MAG: family 10 glycosylhydrolase [Candidatus Omnitrophota bacterium]
MKNIRIRHVISIMLLSALIFQGSHTKTVYAKDHLAVPDLIKGVWITVFSDKKVLYSKNAALDLIKFCRKNNIDEVYLQIYRAGKAYYDSAITDRTEYKKMLEAVGSDPVEFIINEAKKGGVAIHAWINILSIAQNDKAEIIKTHGKGLLTKDQHLKTPIKSAKRDVIDRYYIKEGQLFLEPGDPRVREYVLSVVDEVATRYPDLSGIHLDYIRYPNAVPYIPDSRFNSHGLSYGYGEKNVAAFKKAKGRDPLKIDGDRFNALLWDNWKRDRVTSLVKDISARVKKKNPKLLLSCAVIPSPERAYSVAFQDWPMWLELGIVDHVVTMNYTIDNRLAVEWAKSALAHKARGKVYIGIGVFLMKDRKEIFSEQYKVTTDLNPDGIVFFSYDDITGDIL